MSKSYLAADIEVLSGLEPVRRRPGMYTDTQRPNHLAHEVIDNSVDEAIAGHAKRIEVNVYQDGSLEVIDDGRGMPVDIHPQEKIPGVELILTKLHAGGKFSNKNYRFSGGLHGVGVSVVNALSKHLEVWIRRDGKEYNMSFANGKRRGKLEVVGKVPKNQTGTTLRFWPDPSYFDNPTFSITRLKQVLRAKAVLCPGLEVVLNVEKPEEHHRWQYSAGLEQYLKECLEGAEWLPAEPFSGSLEGKREAVEWAVVWRTDGETPVHESYVNLVPTMQGGTHVNGLRGGLTEALREHCEFRNLLPRGVRLTPEDVWEGVSFVLSVKMEDPQFAGQTKERLGSREIAGFVAVAEPASRDRRRDRAARDLERTASAENREEGRPQADRLRACAARQARGLHVTGAAPRRALPRRGRLGRRLREAGARSRDAGRDAAARQDPEHMGSRRRGAPRIAGGA
jgi:topoisomerase-4 subunit B